MSTSTGGRRHDTLDLKRLSYGLLAAYNTRWVFFAVSRRYVFIQHKTGLFDKRGYIRCTIPIFVRTIYG